MDLLKSIYPYFSCFALLVAIWRIRHGCWKREETLLLSLFAVLFLCVPLQILIADHKIYFARRYLLPMAPLLFGFAAWGVIRLVRRYRIKTKALRILGGGIIFLLLADALAPTLKEYWTVSRKEKNRAMTEMAEFIRRDYRGAARRAVEPWWYEPRNPARPVIRGAPAAFAYLAGGSNWSRFFPDEAIDYLVTESPADGRCGEEPAFRSGRFYVYRVGISGDIRHE